MIPSNSLIRYGQLFQEVTDPSNPFVIYNITSQNVIQQVIAGPFFTAALTTKHQVFVGGSNQEGRCGMTASKDVIYRKVLETNLPIRELFGK